MEFTLARQKRQETNKKPSLPVSWGMLLWSKMRQVRLQTARGGGGGLISKSHLTLATPRTGAHQALLSMGFSRQEYWGGLPFPSPGIEPRSPALQAVSCISGGFFTHWATREACREHMGRCYFRGWWGEDLADVCWRREYSEGERSEATWGERRPRGRRGPSAACSCRRQEDNVPGADCRSEGPGSFPQIDGKPLEGLEQSSGIICLRLKGIGLDTYWE